MMSSGTTTINVRLTLLLSIIGILCIIVLPGLPSGRAATSSWTVGQDHSRSKLDRARRASMQKLYEEYTAGNRFSEEEANILRNFGLGYVLSELEADVVISRALYDHYVAGKELTREQEDLLSRYTLYVSRRDHDVADLKTQYLNRRIAAEAAASPRNTPLVAPANDLCAGAEIIPGAGPFPYLTSVTTDITDATITGDPPLPSCQNSVSRSIWYTFIPATTSDYTISSCADAPTATTVDDTVMAIYTSSTGDCAGTFTELPTAGTTDGCDDDSCSNEAFQAVITTRLTAGTKYFIVVWEFGQSPPVSGNTSVQLSVTRSALTPPNDICSGASNLSLNIPVTGTTAGAGADYSLSGTTCFTGIGNTSSTAPGRDVVYSFTAPAAGNYSFKVTNFDTLSNLVLYASTSCPAPGILTCSALGGPVIAAANRGPVSSSEEIKCLSLTAGQQVFLFVDENGSSYGSSFTIEAAGCIQETEPNDTPAQANVINFSIEGAINPAGDADFYSLGTPAAGSRIFALVDGVAANDSDFDLRITTTTDTLEYDDINNDALFGPLSANVAGTPTNGSQTFLRVNHHSDSPPSTPQASEPYRLYAVVQPPAGTATAELEPNDTIGQANSAANNYFSGTLAGPAPSLDVDIFSFTAQAGEVIFLSLDCDPLRNATPINGALALLNSAGATLISVNDPGFTSSTAASPGTLVGTTPSSPGEALVFRASTSGTFYAKVFIGTDSTGSTGAGDYLLSIAKSPATSSNDTIGLYNPSGAAFFLRNSNTGGIADVSFAYGPVGLTPLSGDWNGDGIDTIGLYNPTTGAFFLRNSNSGGVADISFPYGPAGAGFIPIVGDWNGDGIDTIGLYNPAAGAFFLRNSNSGGVADISFAFGPAGAGFIPIVGDWDGNGTDTVGLYNPATGGWFLRNTNSGGVADITFAFGPGGAGWIPLVGDWDGNGVDTIGLYNPAAGGWFLRNTNTGGVADIAFAFGPAGLGFKPIVG